MREAIIQSLAKIEEDHGCRILYACESGSRAWGFPSPDSDYDVRFLYTHGVDWHLGIGARRDTIEASLPGDLDLAGWELRKALTLFAAGNVALYEWIGSDVVYCDRGGLRQALAELIPVWFQPKKALFHYLGLARRLESMDFAASAGSIKGLFYVVRPLFACQWIQRFGNMPPTDLRGQFGRDLAPGVIEDEIVGLMAAKATLAERGSITPSPDLIRWLHDTFRSVETQAHEWEPDHEAPSLGPLDAILSHHVLTTAGQQRAAPP